MKESGAWLVPTYNNVAYLDKPAFYFKAVALSLAAFGNSETAARLPSAGFGIGVLLLTYAFCRRVYHPRFALMAMMVIAGLPLFLANARTVIFDIALACFTCGAIFAGFLAEESDAGKRRKWYLIGAASTGLATLVKGPVGFMIPILVLLVFHRLQRRQGVLKRLFAPWNFVVFFGITLPWFIGLCRAHPDFLYYGLVEESFHRFTTPKFHRSEPFYFYALIVMATFSPWSILLPEALLATWKQRWAKHPADRLCLVWSVVVVVFFSISQSKLPGYILSVTVSAGILLARIFEVAMANPEGRAARLVRRGMLAFGILCLLGAGLSAVGVANWIGALAKPLKITAEEARLFGQHLVPALVLVAVAGAVALWLQARRDLQLTFLGLAVYPVLLVQVCVKPLEIVFNAQSARRLAGAIPALDAQTQLAFLKCYPNGLPFYLGRTATLITTDGNELTSNYILWGLKSARPWPSSLVPAADFDQWLAGCKSPVYLIADKGNRDKLEQLAARRSATVKQLTPKYLGVLLPQGAP